MSSYSLVGAVVGLALSGAYVIWALVSSRHEKPELTDAAELLLGALAGAGAVKLFVIATSAGEIAGLQNEDRGYMVLGALGVMWVSIVTTTRVFTRPRPTAAPGQPPPPPPGP
jgi:hypothetical protein